MTEGRPHSDPDRDALIAQLASLDEASERGETGAVADSTVKELKAELETLLSDVRQPPPVDEFENESGCRRAMELIQAIGNDPHATFDWGGGPIVSISEALGSFRDYQLLSKLGQGGMGTVYKALHTKLDKIFALKVLPADKLQDKDAVARFGREMKAVGKLEHPNIVRATDAGEVDGKHFLVMEHVDGLDFSAIVHGLGPLGVADACEVARQAAMGLQHAHEHGLVHRDMKPSNLMLTTTGQVKILDMGLALLEEHRADQQRDLTAAGQMMGTLDYMAPEQGADSHDVDIRADVYSLGATLFKLLTGEVPFSKKKYGTPVKLLIALATKSAPSITTIRNDLPPELAGIVDRMLARKPENRFAAPQEVAAALAPFAAAADLRQLSAKAMATVRQPVTDQSAVQTNQHITAASHETTPSLERESKAGTELDSPSPDQQKAFPLEATMQAYSTPQPESPSRRKIDIAPKPRKVQPVRGGTPRNRLLAIAAAAGGILLLGVITLYILTQRGTIVVEIDDPAGLIQVTVEGESIVITEKENEGEPIRLTSGEHRLHVKRGELEFDTEKFKLNRGGRVVVAVKIVQGQVQVVRDETTPIGTRDIPGKAGENFALAFDGKSSYVEIPSLNGMLDGPITVEAYVTPRLASFGAIFASPGDSPIALGIWSGEWQAQKEVGEATADVVFERSRPGKTHVAAIWNRTEMSFFVDGKTATNRTARYRHTAKTNGLEAATLGLGAKRGGEQGVYYFEGAVDEVRISKVARYTDDFTPAKRFDPDEHTIALYHFDEGTGEVLKDSSGNNHHGKIVGAEWVKVDKSGELRSDEMIVRTDPHRRAIAWARSVGGDVFGSRADDTGEWLSSAEQFSPDFVRLTLVLEKRGVTDEGVANLADAQRIVSLNLNGTAVTDECVPHIMTLTNLETLSLDSTAVTLDGVKSIATLPKLTTLHLYDIRIGDVGLAMLARMHQLRDLKVTASGDGGVADFTNAGMAHVGQLSNLESLYLGSGVLVTDDGVRHLSNLTKLKNLALSLNSVTGTGLAHIASLTSLESLTLPARTADEDFRHLSGFKSLRVLAVGSTVFTGAGLEHLPDLPQLDELSFVDSGLDEFGLQQVTRFKSLKRLDIGRTKITEAGLKHVTQLPNLERLDIPHNPQLSVDSIARLKTMLPKCMIYSDFTAEEITAAAERLQQDSRN